MADEPITQPVTPPVAEAPKPNPVEERITDLSSKVKAASEERDAAKAAQVAAEKKLAFAEGFTDVVSANPAAKDHKADIEAKFAAGYTLQDATFAVLGAAGKLGAPQVERRPAAGGSAPNNITIQSNKSAEQMTREERRQALVNAQNAGDLFLS